MNNVIPFLASVIIYLWIMQVNEAVVSGWLFFRYLVIGGKFTFTFRSYADYLERINFHENVMLAFDPYPPNSNYCFINLRLVMDFLDCLIYPHYHNGYSSCFLRALNQLDLRGRC